MRRSTHKAIIGRRVASIVKRSVGRVEGVVSASVRTSDYLIVDRPNGPRFLVTLSLGLSVIAPAEITVGVTKEEHDCFADGYCWWVIDRVASEILREAIPMITRNAVAADRRWRNGA